MAVSRLNANAELMGKSAALFMNINAAKGLQDVMKTNLGPKGTVKMLVGGAGDLKLTKDGNVLLREMQIQNPTAVMIARTAVAQDDVSGDGTSTMVLFIGELLRQAERHLAEGLHPRVIAEGFDIAKKAALVFLDTFKRSALGPDGEIDKELLTAVARTALRTKLFQKMADQLTGIVVEAVLTIRQKDTPLDLHMVEIMHMRHRLESDTKLVRGIVLDHGARHPDMKKYVENAYVLTCNISLEYEKSEVNASFMYSNAETREKMVNAERKYTDERVQAIIDFKKKLCDGTDKEFVIITQKGIDPPALDMLAKAGIVALRRAKRRNMERLVLACGGIAVDAVSELEESALGFAGKVYEHVLGDDAYTFVEDVKNPFSCTVLVKGPNDHTIAQIKDAVRDGLRAVKNVLDDGAVVPGAGAFEVALNQHLLNDVRKTVTGRVKLGVQAFADALMIVPKTLAENSGYETQDVTIALQEEVERGNCAGVDIDSGEPCDPTVAGIYDNYIVKVQIINSAPVIASQLLLVDEVMRAGVNMRSK